MSPKSPDDATVARTLDLALRVGEMLLSSGAGAADVTATMSSITHHGGLRQVYSDVTFTALSLSYQPPQNGTPFALTRHVRQREIDYDDLTAVDHLITALLSDEIDVEDALSRLAQISSTGHARPRWSITAGWAVIGFGVALVLGAGWTVAGIAALAASLLEVGQRLMARRRLPFFYSQIAGGMVVTGLAVGVQASAIPVDPSLVVTTGIVQLLAGLGLIGAIQDALTGFYVTASARILEVVIATAGVIVGVSAALSVGDALGVQLDLDPSAAGWTRLPLMAAGAGLAAAAFAFSGYAPTRILLPIGVLGFLAAAIYLSMRTSGFGPAVPAAVAAVGLGFAAWFVSRRFRVPPLVVVVSCIVPLLPGLSIYRGLTLLSADDIDGVLALITAGAVATALSAGVILGEYIAQPLGREARKLEHRLAGPRLVGPLRVRAVRRARG